MFRQYGIPVFRSVMEDVLQKPVLALVTSALAAVAEDYPYEEMFRYLKTDLTGISREEQDLLENYVLTWNIRGGTWMRAKPWDMHPEGYGLPFKEEDTKLVERLDELRRRVIAPLEELRRNPDKTGRGRALALYSFETQVIALLLSLMLLTGCGNKRTTKETDETTFGIDVSRYQGTIDWHQVAASGIDFAVIRTGYRSMDDGTILLGCGCYV